MDIGVTPVVEEIPLKKLPYGVFKDKDGSLLKLRADSRHMQLYLLRGFQYVGGTDALPTAEQITKAQLESLVERSKGFVESQVVEKFICDVCGEEKKDATALGQHKRIHKSTRRLKK